MTSPLHVFRWDELSPSTRATSSVGPDTLYRRKVLWVLALLPCSCATVQPPTRAVRAAPPPKTGPFRDTRDNGSHDGAMTTPEAPAAETLSIPSCWALLQDSVVGRLAVCLDGQPDIFPVNHTVDHGSVVFRTAAGTKLAAAVRRQVAFEADGYDVSDGTAWSVVVKGKAEKLDEAQELLRALRLPIFPWHDSPKPWFVRIEPTSVTGRRFYVRGGLQENPDSSQAVDREE
jgi:nitroimidazol reductase NimA-like FMN-containing flavoprotein (pyridoxamine 5'-phosphate oxidase superfamily)